jgi:hypothetical protein
MQTRCVSMEPPVPPQGHKQPHKARRRGGPERALDIELLGRSMGPRCAMEKYAPEGAKCKRITER